MQTSNVCSVCNESGHIPRKCPELRSDMNEGFYSGGGSNRDYGEEDQSKYRKELNSRPLSLIPEAVCCAEKIFKSRLWNHQSKALVAILSASLNGLDLNI